VQLPVLDHGYVRLLTSLGSDIDVARAARVSFDKQVDTLEEKDINLINFLVREKHDSTLRHCVVSFEVYAPLMVARQWYKHSVGSTYLDDQMGWNESSRRYITEKEEFYIPTPSQWRSTPANRKQGSGEAVSTEVGSKYYMDMLMAVESGMQAYSEALADGIAPEQARLLLPAYAMYVRWRWTTSLNAVLHFLSLRLDPTAQWEIQQYAQAVNTLIEPIYPNTIKAWNEYRV
jgi:thymidylate synthase (FAD)